jgi:hypothetical protein
LDFATQQAMARAFAKHCQRDGAIPSDSRKKEAQPRRVALRFHQRRRFWRICADTCKGAQRKTIVNQRLPICKRFLLLCNITADQSQNMQYYSNKTLFYISCTNATFAHKLGNSSALRQRTTITGIFE